MQEVDEKSLEPVLVPCFPFPVFMLVMNREQETGNVLVERFLVEDDVAEMNKEREWLCAAAVVIHTCTYRAQR